VYDLGVTHLRVPLPHWILGDVSENEPFIVGRRWQALSRLVQWVREIRAAGQRNNTFEIWPNLHTAPGSQNGFDNSGREAPSFTCRGWDKFPHRVNQTLEIINHITRTFREQDMLDVITGFGLLNEPFGDCNDTVYHDFVERGYDIARTNLGDKVNIFVSDKFYAPLFNNGKWANQYNQHTYLDSHFYHVFFDQGRIMDPVQHVQMTCAPNDLQLSIESCCYQDAPATLVEQQEQHYSGRIPTGRGGAGGGVKRIATEWSVAFDAHPGELLKVVMDGIAYNGIAPNFHRQIEPARKDFLLHFGQAQMVAYEAAHVQDLSDGWFYWTIKMEGGVFAEWDFIRGMEQGYLPKLVTSDTASADVYGTCHDITSRVMHQNYNYTDVVHPFPWMDEPYWRENVPWTIPVQTPPNVTHSVWYNVSSTTSSSPLLQPPSPLQGREQTSAWVHIGAVVLAMYVLRSLYHVMKQLFFSGDNNHSINRSEYTPIHEAMALSAECQPLNLKHVRTQDTLFDGSSSSSSSDAGDDSDDGREEYNNHNV
jgi:glucan 1,3-beta-glucosidase